MNRGRRAAPWLALVAVLAASLAVLVARGGGDASPEARVDDLARDLRCPTCQSESVYESRSATAEAIRADIARRVEAGQSDAEIEQAYVDRYGEWVLLTPPGDGVGFVVWGLPVVVVILGAAGIIAAIRRGGAAASPAPPGGDGGGAADGGRARRRLAWVAGVGAFALVAAAVLTAALGERRPGGTVTGNDVAAPAPTRADPRDPYTRRVDEARALLGSDLLGALRAYDAAAAADPSEPEPPTYIGWIYALTAQQTTGAERAELVDRALAHFDEAAALDPSYPDLYAFRGLVALNLQGDPDAAVSYLQRYLQLAPDGPQADLVRGALARAVEAAGRSTRDGTTTGADRG